MTEDSQQISVSELLKRNGQQVESSGGRRRRGAKGGISVAELTGEIPAVRRRSESRALDSELAFERNPASAPESASERNTASAPEPAPVPEHTTAFAARFDGDVDDDDEPIASRPSIRLDGAAPAGTSRDHQGSWVSRSLQQERPETGIVVPATESAVASSVVKKPEPAPIGTDFFAKPRLEPPAVAKPRQPPAVAKPRPEPHSRLSPEPQLLSGSTLAGDLMRQSQDSAANVGEETEFIEAAPDGSRVETLDGDTRKSEASRRSRREARVEKAEAKKAGRTDGAGEDSTREWLVLIGQGVVAVIAGALLFKGFEKLWDVLPWVALILALLVIVGLVAMVRIVRRTDDITSFVIAVVVGMIVTLGPLALMLASG
ncbi:hypothetical protein [Rhodococcus marinonascens]|uniref:hypothetical protein n=1 Tax=Rhodococcus marinonascens TaxID=38311 RepID=UPI000932B089|nr:hypothetical protein [Rhodococcus marinonascens]